MPFIQFDRWVYWCTTIEIPQLNYQAMDPEREITLLIPNKFFNALCALINSILISVNEEGASLIYNYVWHILLLLGFFYQINRELTAGLSPHVRFIQR